MQLADLKHGGLYFAKIEQNIMKKLKVFDGCTEFGSETQAFKDRGHDVTTLGLERDVDIKMDIRNFHTKEHYDFMWFSPPCTEFSFADWRKGKCKERNADLSIVDACFRIIEEAKPTYWIIENPRGCLRHIIGKPTITVNYSDYGSQYKKPSDLWGLFPWFYSSFPRMKNTIPFRKALGFTKEQKAERSRVPYGLSLAICKAIENIDF